ncbi:hypothetical protein K458DRAFT_393250 [Lentithecium fluviatile CBS 122367]|uniref:Uncharacterized protein n=1 Tax=Lentithecium fluviatile CBS 122367 TaxID=1168545 RepID=A0A6G1IPV0_9PLEO|nr:hypothetical protein K458DRAFT_393250 [Lentithecium fluviatile CBS 122367]
MRIPSIFSVFAIVNGAIAAIVQESADAPTKLLAGRGTESTPIPTLLPQPPLSRHQQKQPKLDFFGWVNGNKEKSLSRRKDKQTLEYDLFGWVNGDERKGLNLAHIKIEPLWCTEINGDDKAGNLKEYHVNFGMLCFVYEDGHDCDPGKGKSDAWIGWDNNDNVTLTQTWKIGHYGCRHENGSNPKQEDYRNYPGVKIGS